MGLEIGSGNGVGVGVETVWFQLEMVGWRLLESWRWGQWGAGVLGGEVEAAVGWGDSGPGW